MSFPIMPAISGPRFRKGQLTLVDAAAVASPLSRVVNIGEPSEDRWVILMAGGSAGGAISSWSAPTCNGVTMTQIAQDGATIGSDGQRGAIWIAKVTQGTTATLAGTLSSLQGVQVYTLTGVRSPTTSFVSQVESGGSAIITNSVPSCCLYYGVDNFGSVTSISNMDALNNVGNNPWFAADFITTASPTTYTIVKTAVALNRFVSWPFDY